MVRNRAKYHIFVGVLDYIPHSPPDCHKLFTSQWNIEQIGFMLLPSKYFTPFCRVFVVGFEHVFIYYEHFVELNQAAFCKKGPDLVILLSQQRGISFRFIVFLHFYCVSRLPQSIFFFFRYSSNWSRSESEQWKDWVRKIYCFDDNQTKHKLEE